jgi:hypothetical protein
MMSIQEKIQCWMWIMIISAIFFVFSLALFWLIFVLVSMGIYLYQSIQADKERS